MKLLSWLATLCFALMPAIGSAGVIYEWQAANDGTPRGITLHLEFDDAAVASGSLSFHVEPREPASPVPDAGLLALHYAFPGGFPIIYFPRTGTLGGGIGILDMEVNFEDDGFLTGSIFVNDTHSHFEMFSAGRLFTIVDANSDQGMPGAGCGFGTDIPCGGATGFIRQVREPGSPALLGFGLLAAFAVRRKAIRP
jgi:hypothetical protein